MGARLLLPEKLELVTVTGIGKLKRVRASYIFYGREDEILQTADYNGLGQRLLLYQDDQTTAISKLMAEQNHIFAAVKKVTWGTTWIAGSPHSNWKTLAAMRWGRTPVAGNRKKEQKVGGVITPQL